MSKAFKNLHLPSIDLLRAVASLGVCFFHLTRGSTPYLDDDNWMKIICRYGEYGVQVFFVVSGFIIPYSLFHKNYTLTHFKHFLLKRALRIEPPYLANIAIILLLDSMSTLYHGKPLAIDWVQVGLHLGYLNAFFNYLWLNWVFWTLAIEFQYYLLIGLLFPLLIYPKKWVRYAVLVTFGGLGAALPLGSLVFYHSLFFIAGILLFQYKCNLMGKREFLAAILLTLGAVCLQRDVPIGLATCLSIAAILYVKQVSRPVVFLSAISYALYLFHLPIGGRVKNLSANFVQDELLRSGMVLVAILASIIAAWIFYRLVELPSLRLSRRVVYNSQQENEKTKQDVVY